MAQKVNYYPKVVVFTQDESKVLLSKRKKKDSEDVIYSFISGSCEEKDKTVIDSLKRGKRFQMGKSSTIDLLRDYGLCLQYAKNDGEVVVSPHFYGKFVGGSIEMKDQFAEREWVDIDEIKKNEKVFTGVGFVVEKILKMKNALQESKFITI